MLTDEQIRRSFSQMATLAPGWNGYEAEPPGLVAMGSAMWFVGEMVRAGVPIDRMAPSAVGGVGVTMRRNGLRAYAEFLNDTSHRFCVLWDYGNEEEPQVFTLELDSSVFRKAPNWIREFLWLDETPSAPTLMIAPPICPELPTQGRTAAQGVAAAYQFAEDSRCDANRP